MKEVYINGVSFISGQNTVDKNWFFDDVKKPLKNYFKVDELSFKNSVPINVSRRMSKIVRMGVASAMNCLKDAGVENVNAIIAGTGMGCFEDSEKFLRSMIENEETLLSPATFIQSTHNTVAAQIALFLKCHEYNFTYVHRGFSFESALQDALLQIHENAAKNILVGGIDEITSEYLDLIESTGWLKSQVNSENYFQNETDGAIAGEGSSFFLLSGNKSSSSYVRLTDVKTIYKPSVEELQKATEEFLSLNQLNLSDIDAIIFGLSGDAKSDQKIKSLMSDYFQNNLQLSFKNYFGECPIAASFALWIAAVIIKKKTIPEILRLNETGSSNPRNILICNQYNDKNYSLILVSEC